MTKVIKRNSVDSGPAEVPALQYEKSSGRKGVIDKDVYSAKQEAQRILERVKQESAAIISKARKNAEQIQARAREQGYKEGKEQGAAEVSEMLARQTIQFNELMGSVEPQVIDLTMGIVKKVFGEEIAVNPEVVVKVTRSAMRTVRQRREITIRANPDDVAALQRNRRELLDMLLRTNDIVITEDSGIMRGGVIIETEAGRVDARLETQLDVFEKIFTGQSGHSVKKTNTHDEHT